MGAVNTTYTFTATDTITSAKMNNIIDQTTMTGEAIIGTTLEVASGKLKVRAAGITANEIAAGQITPALTNFANSLLPAGAVMAFAMNTAPAGWLAADGSSVSTSGVNATLFAAIGYTYGGSGGSFNLPDLRGIFVRGSGSQTIDGVTYNKTFAAKENDAIQAHTHSSAAAELGSQLLAGGVNGAAVNGFSTGGINVGRSDSNETRPANIALLYCIKL